jgi:plasmid maintenance system antidote protein VapI
MPKTIQIKIFELSEIELRKDFAAQIKLSGSYVSNVLISDKNISTETAIQWCKSLNFSQEETINLITEHIKQLVENEF